MEAGSILEYEWEWVTAVAETLLARDSGAMTGDEIEAVRPSTNAAVDGP
jgi:hypothetical protein